jgi:hypothetical protein
MMVDCLAMPIDKSEAYRGEGNPKWRGNDAKYLARHARVRTVRGKATEYECSSCGTQIAREWAQVHGGDPFDVMAYQPMCIPCHRDYDRLQCVRGEDHPDAKLTEEKVREIRKRYAAGETQVTLAAEFDVLQGTVSKIVLRRTWKEVTP